MNNTKLFIFSSLALFLVNCAGTSPRTGWRGRYMLSGKEQSHGGRPGEPCRAPGSPQGSCPCSGRRARVPHTKSSLARLPSSVGSVR